MGDKDRRAVLVTELSDALGEVARLSEMMTVLAATHVIDYSKVQELHKELRAAKAAAAQLQQALERIDTAPPLPPDRV